MPRLRKLRKVRTTILIDHNAPTYHHLHIMWVFFPIVDYNELDWLYLAHEKKKKQTKKQTILYEKTWWKKWPFKKFETFGLINSNQLRCWKKNKNVS